MKFKVQNSKFRIRSSSVVMLLLAVAGTIIGLAKLPNQAEGAYNLLANPGFEDGYSYRLDPYEPWKGTQGELEVANGWELWYDNRDQCRDGQCCYNYRPEYKYEDGHIHTDPLRVRSGRYAQKMFTLFSTHTAGLYQRVAVPEGTQMDFSIWVTVWSSSESDPHHSTHTGKYWLSVGIDPYGGTDPFADRIIWSDEIEHYDEHVQLSVTAVAQADHATVFTKAAPVWCVKHNDSYWDDARLAIDLPFKVFLPLALKNYGTPIPTATPTSTSTSTPTPTPTNSSTPTYTPTNTPTVWTATPTATSTATATPTATLTPTASPTNTPTATSTPTATPTTPPPDLSTSSKTADRDNVDYFETVFYTIVLRNSGAGVATSVRITDTIPSLLTYLDDSISGGAVYDSETNTITWVGSLAGGESHTISFGCDGPSPIIPHDTLIVNEVVIDDGIHAPFARNVTVIGNPWPTATPTASPTAMPTGTPTATPTVTPTPTRKPG